MTRTIGIKRSLKQIIADIRNLMLGADKQLRAQEKAAPSSHEVETKLYERIKELICLHGINEIVFRHGRSLDTVLQGIAEILPEALQHNQAAGAVISFAGKVYRSPPDVEIVLQMKKPIFVNGRSEGSITLGYGPGIADSMDAFLREERLLLATVSEHVGQIIQRAKAEQALQEANAQLSLERKALHESNIALRALTDRLSDEKRAIAATIRSNLDHSVTPILDEMRRELPPGKKAHIALLKHCIEDLVSPFTHRIRSSNPRLTPTEQEICQSIRAGLTSKEIATLRGISAGTVHRHRENIRRKLGLRRSDKNLVSFLRSMSFEES